MDKKTAEILYWMTEYVSDSGRWFDLCGFLEEKGITPKQIVEAVNSAAKSAGYVAGLKEEDCS